MFPSIDITSLFISLLSGAVFGYIIGRLLRSAYPWITFGVAAFLLIATPFVGHGTWIIGFSVTLDGPLSGVHLQYCLTGITLFLAALTIYRFLSRRQTKFI